MYYNQEKIMKVSLKHNWVSFKQYAFQESIFGVLNKN